MTHILPDKFVRIRINIAVLFVINSRTQRTGIVFGNGRVRPVGSQNEAYLQSHWNWDAAPRFDRINSWLVAWPGAFRLETLRKLDAIDLPQIE